MVESARIARGEVKDLALINASEFDAILLPGGFGAAKNLSSFGFKGAEMTVQSDVEKALKAFHSS
jgi:enhancing lycopene biosynthesis protein 2